MCRRLATEHTWLTAEPFAGWTARFQRRVCLHVRARGCCRCLTNAWQRRPRKRGKNVGVMDDQDTAVLDDKTGGLEGCGMAQEQGHKATVEALEAKLGEVGSLLEVLKSENEGLRRQMDKRKGERESGTKQGSTDALVTRQGSGGHGNLGRVLTSTGYGFVGCQARPKDLAAAEVTGVAPPPVQMHDKIEGGGAVWERQPVVGLRPIGYLESCFLEKNGTPRQGNVARTSRASLSLLFGTNPSHCLQGLSDFSHVWVLWLFHGTATHTHTRTHARTHTRTHAHTHAPVHTLWLHPPSLGFRFEGMGLGLGCCAGAW